MLGQHQHDLWVGCYALDRSSNSLIRIPQTIGNKSFYSEVSRTVRQVAVNHPGNQLQVRILSSEPF